MNNVTIQLAPPPSPVYFLWCKNLSCLVLEFYYYQYSLVQTIHREGLCSKEFMVSVFNFCIKTICKAIYACFPHNKHHETSLVFFLQVWQYFWIDNRGWKTRDGMTFQYVRQCKKMHRMEEEEKLSDIIDEIWLLLSSLGHELQQLEISIISSFLFSNQYYASLALWWSQTHLRKNECCSFNSTTLLPTIMLHLWKFLALEIDIHWRRKNTQIIFILQSKLVFLLVPQHKG